MLPHNYREKSNEWGHLKIKRFVWLYLVYLLNPSDIVIDTSSHGLTLKQPPPTIV